MDSRIIVLLAVVAGLSAGYGVSIYQEGGQSYCKAVEEGVRQNQSFQGTVDCFEPGVIPVNVSEDIQNRSDLECVCRHSSNGDVRLFPIFRS